MSEKQCAACGKLFQPKGRERYCPGPHYKPCPVCGEMVVATYWSDPPKRCDKCRAANAKVAHAATPAPISHAELEVDNPTRTIEMDSSTFKYVGPERIGIPFKTDHIYILKIEKEEKYGCYVVTSAYDVTAEENIDAYMRYSSMIGVNRSFVDASAER